MLSNMLWNMLFALCCGYCAPTNAFLLWYMLSAVESGGEYIVESLVEYVVESVV